MEKSIRKKSAKVADTAIKKAQLASREAVTETPSNGLLERLAEARVNSERDGRGAYAELKKLRNGKLPRGSEITIAMRLYGEVRALDRHLKAKGLSKAEFCSRFGLHDSKETSKELNRLTVSPGSSADEVRSRRLRRHADKYRYLIDGVCEITGQSKSALADRVLMGTPLHPIEQFAAFNETENVLNALQGIVDRIDHEFGLYAKFMEIASLKAAHIGNGGSEHWPTFDADLEDARSGIDPRNAFWPSDQNHDGAHWDNHVREEWGVVGAPEFFYTPHTRIGIVDYCNLPEKANSGEEYERAVHDFLKSWRSDCHIAGETLASLKTSYGISWDSVRQCPIVQSRDTNPDPMGVAWLIIYPSKDHGQLVPLIYFVGEFPVLIPLDVRNLDVLRNGIWLDEKKWTSVFDRIKELIGYRDGATPVIENELRRTAPWLDHNPFFKMRQTEKIEQEREMAMLHAYMRKLREDL